MNHETMLVQTRTEIPPGLWTPMTVERYAALIAALGGEVLKQGKTWWRNQGRPLFYRPLLPYKRYDLAKTRSQIHKLAVFQYGVERGQDHNSHLNFVVFDDVRNYDAKKLGESVLRNLKAAVKNQVEIRRIVDEEEFTSKAYNVYLSSYRRNGYGANTKWGQERRDPAGFARWAHGMFQFPETIILGAFSRSELLSFEISWLVEDTVILATVVHSNKGLELRSPDLLLHQWRVSARECRDVNIIYDSPFNTAGVNEFKIRRGGRAMALPAYINLHAVVLRLLRKLRDGSYTRLVGRAPSEPLSGGRLVEAA